MNSKNTSNKMSVKDTGRPAPRRLIAISRATRYFPLREKVPIVNTGDKVGYSRAAPRDGCNRENNLPYLPSYDITIN